MNRTTLITVIAGLALLAVIIAWRNHKNSGISFLRALFWAILMVTGLFFFILGAFGVKK